MAESYRFGGPTPESVQTLGNCRKFRASSLYARMKRGLGEKLEEERAQAIAKRTLPLRGEQFPCPPAEYPPAG